MSPSPAPRGDVPQILRSVRHPRPPGRRRRHVARDQRSRRGRPRGHRDRRRRGAGAARRRRGRPPGAAGRVPISSRDPWSSSSRTPGRAGRWASVSAQRVQRRFSARRLVPKWQRLLSDDGGGRAGSARGAHRGVGSAARLPVGDPDPDGHVVQRLVRDVSVPARCPRSSRTSGWTSALYDRMLDECAREPGLRRIEPFLMNEAVHRQPHDRLDRAGQAAGAARHGDGDDQRLAARPEGHRSAGAHRASTPSGSASTAPRRRPTRRSWASRTRG